MAVALRAGSTFSALAVKAAGVTQTAPTTIVNGDCLVIVMIIYNPVIANFPATVTPPAGFTLFTTSPALPVALPNVHGDVAKLYLYYKVAASESGNYALTWTSNASNQSSSWMGSYSGADATTPVTVTGTSATATTATWSTTGVTTTVNGSMVIFAGCDYADDTNAYVAPAQTPPTFALVQSTVSNQMAIAEGVVTTAGATGSPITAPNETVAGDPNCCALVVVNASGGVVASIPDLIMAPPHR